MPVTVKFSDLGSYIDVETPMLLPLLTVNKVWGLHEIDASAGGDSEYQHDGPLAKAGSRVVVIEVIEGDTRDPSLGVVSQKRAPRLKVFLYDAWADACQHVVKDDLLALTVPIQFVMAAEERDIGDLPQWIVFAPTAILGRHSRLLAGLTAAQRSRVANSACVALKRAVERRTVQQQLQRCIEAVGEVRWGDVNGSPPVVLPRRMTKREESALLKEQQAAMLAEQKQATTKARDSKKRSTSVSISAGASSSSGSSSSSSSSGSNVGGGAKAKGGANQPDQSASSKYDYVTLAEALHVAKEGGFASKKRVYTWGVVLRVTALKASMRNSDYNLRFEVCDESMNPGHREPQFRHLATCLFFCSDEAQQRRALSNLVLRPGAVVRFHRVSVKVWEGKLQLSGNVSTFVGGGKCALAAYYALNPLRYNIPSSVLRRSVDRRGGGGSTNSSPKAITLDAPQRSQLDRVIRNPRKRSRRLSASNGGSSARPDNLQNDSDVSDNDEGVMDEDGGVDVHMKVLSKEALADYPFTCLSLNHLEMSRAILYMVIDPQQSPLAPKPRAFYHLIGTKSSVGASEPHWERCLDLHSLGFHLLAYRGRLPKFGIGNDAGQKDQWARLTDIPRLMTNGNPHGVTSSISGASGGLVSPFERMKLDIVVLVLQVSIEYESFSSSSSSTTAKKIKGIKLVVWDGSGVPTNGSGPSGNVDVEVMRAYGRACIRKNAMEGAGELKISEVVENVDDDDAHGNDDDEMEANSAPRRQMFPNKAPALFVLMNAALESAATMRALVATGARDTYTLDDPLEREICSKATATFSNKAKNFRAKGCRVTINIDVDALNRLRHDTFSGGISSEDADAMKGLKGLWLRLCELTDYQVPPGNTAANTFSLKFDEKSIAEIMPNHCAEVIALVEEYECALQRQEASSASSSQSSSGRAQWSSQNEELSCLMEILATPFQDTFVCRAKVTRYYPQKITSDASSSSMSQFEMVQQDFGVAQGLLRWVVALELEDDSASIEAMLTPPVAEHLLGTPSTSPVTIEKARSVLERLACGIRVECRVKKDYASSTASSSSSASQLRHYITELRAIGEVGF